MMRTNSNSVANYYQEVSYGQHLLNVTVTPWVMSASSAPATCDYTAIGLAANAAATAAGFTPSSYDNRYYVFPRRADCGGPASLTSTLARRGATVTTSSTSTPTSSATTLVCFTQRVSIVRVRSLEDPAARPNTATPFDVMGNISAMYFNAAVTLRRSSMMCMCSRDRKGQ